MPTFRHFEWEYHRTRGEIKTPLENSGVNRTISVRGGEGRETTAQRERENRFGLEREGGECSQGRKFDDDHDYDGWRSGGSGLVQVCFHGVWAAVALTAELPVDGQRPLPAALSPLRLTCSPPARQHRVLRDQHLQQVVTLPLREPSAPQPVPAILSQQHGRTDKVRRHR